MLSFSECKEKIESEIHCLNFDQYNPAELYEPVSYILSLGGKRIRPVLTLLACNLFAEDVSNAIHPALAVEIFHNFTLLHDDIMDCAPVRRNQPTVHTKWNNNVAILSGDAMSIIAYQQLCKTTPELIPELLSLFSKTALEICEGQQMDMNFETRNQVTIPEYITMIKLKTAVLLAASLKMGAICAKAPAMEQNKLYDFGLNLGLAFQIQDDLLDTFGNQKDFGKSIGGDIIARKKTYLYLKALETANPSQKEELIHLYGDKSLPNDTLIKQVVAIFNQLHIPEVTKKSVEEYTQQAMLALESVNVMPDLRKPLHSLALEIMDRKG